MIARDTLQSHSLCGAHMCVSLPRERVCIRAESARRKRGLSTVGVSQRQERVLTERAKEGCNVLQCVTATHCNNVSLPREPRKGAMCCNVSLQHTATMCPFLESQGRESETHHVYVTACGCVGETKKGQTLCVSAASPCCLLPPTHSPSCVRSCMCVFAPPSMFKQRGGGAGG